MHLHSVPQVLSSLRTVGLEASANEGIVYSGGHKEAIECISVDSIGRSIATTSKEGQTVVWDVASCQVIENVKINASFVAFIAPKSNEDYQLMVNPFKRTESEKENSIVLQSQVNSDYQ